MLESKAVPALAIEDDELGGVTPPELVPADLHAEAVATLFRAIVDLLALVRPFRFEPLRVIQRELRSPAFAQRALRSEALNALEPMAWTLLDELCAGPPIDGVLSPLMPVSSVHRAVDSALLAVALGSRAGLPRARQRQLGLGMLLRDVGMMFVDPAALETQGELPPAVWNRVRHHPVLGSLLARLIAPNDVFTQTVIQQHHERQDGTGYPRGLTGSNRLRRPRGSDRPQGVVSLEGEIAALIDVYTAIASHRPYRGALAPDAGVREVLGQAHSALNAELTQLFGRSIAWYPVLSRVRVLSGDYENCAGYVLSAGAERP